jgi:hypothetical protein
MALRLSISEAQQKKLINESQAQEMRTLQKARRPSTSKKATSAKKTPASPPEICPIEGATPQQKLWRALVHQYPELIKSKDLCWELGGAVPGRRYVLDISFKDMKLGLEVDGWEFHGKNIKNFKRDRQKDRLLMLAGWRVLRFFASEINHEIESVLQTIEQARVVVAEKKQVKITS